MKKHDEGYVLAYVTVVLLVFCLVATMILTGAMKNLQAQQDDIARMQDQYAAQGIIEQALAKLEANDTTEGIEGLTVTAADGGGWTLKAESGTVVITCTYDSDLKCTSYTMDTADATEPATIGTGGGA